MGSVICFSWSVVIVDMLNTFTKNYIYSKAQVNDILSIIHKNDLIT